MLTEEKVFRDPLHNYIYVNDSLIWDLINTKEFQRLRRIKQLGTSYFTFHGAEHSRFSHSLGVYEITRKIINHFARNNYLIFTEEERLLALSAALLHDLGHGPFSHAMEKVFQTQHEDWSKRIILGDTDVYDRLEEVNADFPQKVANVIGKTYNNSLIIDLVSSQLDADRMDYLLRDAYFTGVSYGMFDLERILRVLRPLNGRIVAKESGMHSIEAYLMARYQMYWQVYFHPVTRSADIILRKIFLRARDLYLNGYKFQYLLPPVAKLLGGNLSLEDYLELDEPFVYTMFHLWASEKDNILKDLAFRFINRKLFTYFDVDIKKIANIKQVEEYFRKKNIEYLYYGELDAPTQVPYDFYQPQANSEANPILLINNSGEVFEISQKSDVIAAFSGNRKKERKLFFPKEFFTQEELKYIEYILRT